MAGHVNGSPKQNQKQAYIYVCMYVMFKTVKMDELKVTAVSR